MGLLIGRPAQPPNSPIDLGVGLASPLPLLFALSFVDRWVHSLGSQIFVFAHLLPSVYILDVYDNGSFYLVF